MTVFDSYAASYDLLYQDKDYPAEASFVLDRLRCHSPRLSSVLELGCGTGAHAATLAKAGVRVHGIDLSHAMASRAEARRAALPASEAERLSFDVGDIRDYRFDRRFDAVVSLFHVMTYQITDDDFSAALRTAAHHLQPGGAFLFDFWYGPAVLTDPPAVRIKRVASAELKVTRLAEPVLHHERNVVDVDYHVFSERIGGVVDQVRESHRLRYWFWPEIRRLALSAGLEPVGLWKWMSDEPADAHSWLAYVICRKPSTAGPS